MAQVSETIRVVVSGVNPQTKNYSILVDTTTGHGVGAGNPLAISYTGVAAGTDSITAYMDAHSLTSNVAEIAWQAVNLSIALSPVTMNVYANSSQTPGYVGFGGAFQGTITSNSLVINQVIQNYPLSPFCARNNISSCGGGYKQIPLYTEQQQNTGQAFASNLPIPGSGSGSTGNPVVVDMTGYLIVATPGVYTVYMQFANVSQSAFWVGGGASVTYNNGNNTGSNPFPANGPNSTFWTANGGSGSSHLACANNVNPGLYGGTRTCYINFPTAGKYPFEAYYNQRNPVQFSGDNNGYWQLTYVAGPSTQYNQEGNRGDTGPTFQPVSITNPPPAGTVGSRQLQLSVASGVATPSSPTTELELQGTTQFLYLTVSGVPYTTIPYIPVLEGVAGGVFLYDTSPTNRFDFGEISGAPIIFPPVGGVSPTTAAVVAANVASLSGDNTAWTGLFNLPYSGTPPSGFYTLAYNGGSVVSGVDVTNLTITANDIAWFDSADNSIDLFTASSGGILQYPIQIAYMVMPNRAGITVTPSTLQADGHAQTLNVNLPKPMSPEQQGLYGTGNTVNAPTVSCTGGVTVTTPPSPVLNGSGWLTGWTMKVTVPSSSSSGSFQLTFGVTGTLTYLSANTFVTGTVTYISGASALATIATTGNSYTAPTNYSFVVSGGRTGTAPNYTITGSITLTAVIFSTDNGSFVTAPGSNSFFRIYSATKTTIAAGALVSGPTPVTGGYHTTIALTTTSAFAWGTPVSLGYTATDSLSGLSVSYTDSNTYNNGNPNPGGGGSCFTGSVEIKAPEGFVAFEDFPKDEAFEIVNETGTHTAELIVHENYAGWMVVLDGDKLVTLDHVMKMSDGAWDRADEKYADLPHVWFEGTVYNLHVLSDDEQDRHYILFNGDVAHNLKAGGGGCFTASVEIETPAGLMPFGCFPTDQPFEIVNKTGTHLAMLVIHKNYTDQMVVLDGDRLVTVGHGMGVDGLMPAAEKYPDLPRVQFTGTVYNLHILSDDPADKHYILWNGDVAHNVIKA